MDAGLDDVSDTQRLSLALRSPASTTPEAPVTQGQMELIRHAVSKLVDWHRDSVTERRTVRWIGGVLGGLVSAAALGMGGYALTLAQQASSDHERLDRVEAMAESTAEALPRTRDDLIERGQALTVRVERIDVRLERIETALDRMGTRLETLLDRVPDRRER